MNNNKFNEVFYLSDGQWRLGRNIGFKGLDGNIRLVVDVLTGELVEVSETALIAA